MPIICIYSGVWWWYHLVEPSGASTYCWTAVVHTRLHPYSLQTWLKMLPKGESWLLLICMKHTYKIFAFRRCRWCFSEHIHILRKATGSTNWLNSMYCFRHQSRAFANPDLRELVKPKLFKIPTLFFHIPILDSKICRTYWILRF